MAFLEEVEGWLPQEVERVYAIADNLSSHRAPDVLLFMLAHPRWEMVFQPKYAAYLNLIEPWWKVLRSLALAGRRFETWDEVWEAVDQATAYWNAQPAPLRSGGDGAVTGRAVSPASRSCPRPRDLPDEPLMLSDALWRSAWCWPSSPLGSWASSLGCCPDPRERGQRRAGTTQSAGAPPVPHMTTRTPPGTGSRRKRQRP